MQCPCLDRIKFGKISARVVVAVDLFKMKNLTCFHLSQVHVDCGRSRQLLQQWGICHWAMSVLGVASLGGNAAAPKLIFLRFLFGFENLWR